MKFAQIQEARYDSTGEVISEKYVVFDMSNKHFVDLEIDDGSLGIFDNGDYDRHVTKYNTREEAYSDIKRLAERVAAFQNMSREERLEIGHGVEFSHHELASIKKLPEQMRSLKVVKVTFQVV